MGIAYLGMFSLLLLGKNDKKRHVLFGDGDTNGDTNRVSLEMAVTGFFP
jgi:hypothetical protein